MPPRVIITRPRPQAGAWLQALRAAGLHCEVLALMEVGPVAHSAPLAAAWQRLADFDAVLFVSANAVDYFFAACPGAVVPGDAWTRTRALATGPGSVAALLRAGVPRAAVDAPDALGGTFDSEALWQVVQARMQAGTRVLIVRGDTPAEGAARAPADAAGARVGVGRDWFGQQVLARGGSCDYVVAYERHAPQLNAAERAVLQSAAQDGSVWLFSSSQALGNLRQLAPGQSWQGARALATHERIAQSARALGFGSVQLAPVAMDALIASIESLA